MSEEQHNEDGDGLTLALGALSETLNKNYDVLSKMSERFEKQDKEKEKQDEEVKKAEEQKSIVNDVIKALEDGGYIEKQDAKQSAKTIDTNPEKQQDVIQAANAKKKKDEEEVEKQGKDEEEEYEEKKSVKKQDKDEEEYEEKKGKDEEEYEEKKAVKKQNKDDDEEEEEEKKGKKKEEEYPEVEKLKKQVEELQKSFDEKVEASVDERLRRMGWKQEDGLKAPKRTTSMGDDSDVKKSTDVDNVEELAKLDYGTLKKMEMEAEADQLPDGVKQFLRNQ